MKNWFEDENFWKELYPILFPEERILAATEQAEKILALAEFDGTTILDLACGPGRHSVVLAKKGYKVTGVDLSQFHLGKARELAAKSGVEVEWVNADMREFSRPESFDMTMNLFTSLGYFEDRDDDIKVIQNLYDCLKKGGTCVIDLVGKEWVAKGFTSSGTSELDDGSLFIERRKVIEDWTRTDNHWIILKDGKSTEFRFKHRLYSAQELKDCMKQVGFIDIRIYGDLDGNPYGTKAKRLIAIARK